MNSKLLEIETISIVFIGDFNPIILQPFWLVSKGLIRENEAENAKVEVLHNELVKFELGDWAKIEVTKNRFELRSTKEPYFDPLKDLATSIFKILRETPIRALGINHIYDCKMPNEEKYLELGKILTPLEIWNSEFNDPRLSMIEIIENVRKDGEKGIRRIRISPSDQKIPYGVAININNHFDLGSEKHKISAVSQLEKVWKNSFEHSEIIVNKLFEQINL